MPDEFGYYDRHVFEATGGKFRPLDFAGGEVYVDDPDATAKRASWRNVNSRYNYGEHRQRTTDLVPLPSSHKQMQPGTEYSIV